jgi:hypothetical protein
MKKNEYAAHPSSVCSLLSVNENTRTCDRQTELSQKARQTKVKTQNIINHQQQSSAIMFVFRFYY